MNSIIDIGVFKTLDSDPGGTFTKFNDYIEQLELLTSNLLVLEESDVLKLTASVGTQVTGVASILEQDRT